MEIYVTVDIDWAPDEEIAELIDLLNTFGVRPTLFATHDSPYVADLAERHGGELEIGLHPNFDSLIAGQAEHTSAATVISELKAVYPFATSVRSHCLTSGTRFSTIFRDHGLERESNYYLGFDPQRAAEVDLGFNWAGLRNIPFHWSDYIDIVQFRRTERLSALSKSLNKLVIALHPVHIVHNMVDVDHYVAGKEDRSWSERNRVRSRVGARDVVTAFLSEVASDHSFKLLMEF